MIYFCVAAALVLAVVLFDVLAPGRAARFWIGLERRRARLVLKRLTIAGLDGIARPDADPRHDLRVRPRRRVVGSGAALRRPRVRLVS
jgi:hypothetical protein